MHNLEVPKRTIRLHLSWSARRFLSTTTLVTCTFSVRRLKCSQPLWNRTEHWFPRMCPSTCMTQIIRSSIAHLPPSSPQPDSLRHQRHFPPLHQPAHTESKSTRRMPATRRMMCLRLPLFQALRGCRSMSLIMSEPDMFLEKRLLYSQQCQARVAPTSRQMLTTTSTDRTTRSLPAAYQRNFHQGSSKLRP